MTFQVRFSIFCDTVISDIRSKALTWKAYKSILSTFDSGLIPINETYHCAKAALDKVEALRATSLFPLEDAPKPFPTKSIEKITETLLATCLKDDHTTDFWCFYYLLPGLRILFIDLAGKSPQDIVFYNGLSLAAILLQNLDDKDIPKEELESFDKAFKRFVNVLEVIEPREFTRQFSSLPLLPFPYEKKRKPK